MTEPVNIAIDIAIAAGLGFLIFYLQRRTDKNIEEIILSNNKRNLRRKHYWLTNATYYLQQIKQYHEYLKKWYEDYLKEPIPEKGDILFSSIQQNRSVVEDHYIPELRVCIGNTIDFLDAPEIAIYLPNLIQQFSAMCSIDRSVLQDEDDISQNQIPNIDGIIRSLDEYIEILKKEIPELSKDDPWRNRNF